MLGIEAKPYPNPVTDFGTAAHKAIELNANKPAAEWTLGPEVLGPLPTDDQRALLSGTMAAYARLYEGSLNYQSTELRLETEITPRVTLVTHLDGTAVTRTGALALVEHKTTTSDISPGSFYWERLGLDLQISAYMLAGRAAGLSFDHVEYDVMKRPTVARRMITPESAREYYQRDGKYGLKGEPKPGTYLETESVQAYAARVRDEALANPTAYFQRTQLYRDHRDMNEAEADIQAVSDQICKAWDTFDTEGPYEFPRNTQSCYAYNRKCEYLPVCSHESNLADQTLYQIRTEP